MTVVFARSSGPGQADPGCTRRAVKGKPGQSISWMYSRYFSPGKKPFTFRNGAIFSNNRYFQKKEKNNMYICFYQVL
jgi:hypothetical protein